MYCRWLIGAELVGREGWRGELVPLVVTDGDDVARRCCDENVVGGGGLVVSRRGGRFSSDREG